MKKHMYKGFDGRWYAYARHAAAFVNDPGERCGYLTFESEAERNAYLKSNMYEYMRPASVREARKHGAKWEDEDGYGEYCRHAVESY